MMKINRRDFTKYISSIPFIGGILSSKLLANDTVKSRKFDLINELENICFETQAAINKCDAFQIFNVDYLDPGQIAEYHIDEVAYFIPGHGHKPQRFLLNKPPQYYPYSLYNPIACAVDWKQNACIEEINDAIQLFIDGMVRKINVDAFNLLKYSGMDNVKRDWSKIKQIYGTKNGIEKFLSKPPKLYTDEQMVFITKVVKDDNGLQDNEVVGLSMDYKDHLFIPIRERLSVWDDPVLHRQMRKGFYGWMELGFVNTGKNTCYYVNTDNI